MTKLVVAQGLPGSGKSSEIIRAVWRDGGVRVGRDFTRDALFDKRKTTPEEENLVTISEEAQVRALLVKGVDVYIDAMNLRAQYVKRWAKIARECFAEFKLWNSFTAVSVDECVRRDALRDEYFRVGGEVIRSLHKRYFPLPDLSHLTESPDSSSLDITPYVMPENRPEAYIADVDGTCTTGPYDRSPYDWSKVGQDQPNQAVIQTIKTLSAAGYEIVFCSGRSDECRPETKEWLRKHVGNLPSSVLFMRKAADISEKDYLVKLKIFNEEIRHNYRVIGVFDDRPQVIRMWRKLGLSVFNVGDGKEF